MRLALALGIGVLVLVSGVLPASAEITLTNGVYKWLGDAADLDHYKYHQWNFGLDGFDPTKDYETLELSIKFDDIYDWTIESTDRLHVSLLDTDSSAPSHLVGSDGQDATDHSGDGYASTRLFTWTDPIGNSNYKWDLVYTDTISAAPTLATTPATYTRYGITYGGTSGSVVNNVDATGILSNYISDGFFGLGMDPDCHYYNGGIKVKVAWTEKSGGPIPEPCTFALLGLAAGAGALLKRRKRS